ncbi:MAG: response regulator transcription factor [Dehalococcoidia bacterium]|nr:response regulator transcription factor [Dehalococcoidia bacterium]MDD5494007.1 response regulator transcription factor [Dehalococcoidia bacterium]
MKVMLVDDHPLFLEGLQNLLEAHGVEVAGTAGDGLQALVRAREMRPDVILMDIAMPVCSGLDAIRPIKEELPGVKIVMLTSLDNDDNLFEAVKRGASGYLLKNLNADELVALLHTLERGDAPLSPGLAARLLAEFSRQPESTSQDAKGGQEKATSRLTLRQAEVLKLVAQGKTYKEAGAELHLSERTIKYHMERILQLLQLENRSQAIAYAAGEKADSSENKLE